MDETKYLIIVNEKDKTKEIAAIKEEADVIHIAFAANGKTYTYRRSSSKVIIYKDPEIVSPSSSFVYLR